MKTYNFSQTQLQDIFILSQNITRSESAIAAIKQASAELCSLNRVLKTMKGATIFALLESELAKVGVTNPADLTVKNLHSLIPDSLKKVVTEKDENGEEVERTVICTVRRKYETEVAFLYDEQGRKLAKKVTKKDGSEEFVPRTQKIVRIDADGDKVVKGYELRKINAWSIQAVLDLLANATIIRRERIVAAEVEETETETESK